MRYPASIIAAQSSATQQRTRTIFRHKRRHPPQSSRRSRIRGAAAFEAQPHSRRSRIRGAAATEAQPHSRRNRNGGATATEAKAARQRTPASHMSTHVGQGARSVVAVLFIKKKSSSAASGVTIGLIQDFAAASRTQARGAAIVNRLMPRAIDCASIDCASIDFASIDFASIDFASIGAVLTCNAARPNRANSARRQ